MAAARRRRMSDHDATILLYCTISFDSSDTVCTVQSVRMDGWMDRWMDR